MYKQLCHRYTHSIVESLAFQISFKLVLSWQGEEWAEGRGTSGCSQSIGLCHCPLGQAPTGVSQGGSMKGYAKGVWEIVRGVFDGFSDEGLYVVHEFNFI